jgi:molybdate transport system regulatory protein
MRRNKRNRRKERIIPRARLFLSTAGGRGVFGSGRWELLAAVGKYGSLHRAAAVLGRSYRKAWADINTMEKRLGFNLVIRSRGGASGGTMRLTARGRTLLPAWERYSGCVMKAAGKYFEKYISEAVRK